MKDINLLYKIVWEVSKRYRVPFAEIIGEGYIKWSQIHLSYCPDKGALAPYMWSGVGRGLSYEIEKESKRGYFFTSLEPQAVFKGQVPGFEMPEGLSDKAKKIAELALVLWRQSEGSVVPTKATISLHCLSQGLKWREIREAFKELRTYF